MYFLVEGYDRNAGASYGKIVAAQAVTAQQLAGAIIRMLRHGGANLTTTTEISEEVFEAFFQENMTRVYTHEGQRRHGE